jgi:hypothetical protein
MRERERNKASYPLARLNCKLLDTISIANAFKVVNTYFIFGGSLAIDKIKNKGIA